jgi:hypothetical protein
MTADLNTQKDAAISLTSVDSVTDEEKTVKDQDVYCITTEKNRRQSIEEEEPYTVFSKSRLIHFLIILSLTGMLSPLTGNIYLPSLNQIEAVSSSNSSSAEKVNPLSHTNQLSRALESLQDKSI